MSDLLISRRARTLLTATAALPLSLVATTVLTAQQPAAATSTPPDARVEAVMKKAPVIDGHNDLPWEMREKVRYDWDARDIAKPQPVMMTDIPRLRSGHVGGQFWSVYVPATLQGDAAVSATLEQVDSVYEMVRRYPNVFTLVRTADEMAAAMKAGRIGSLMGMEGGHSIDSSLATLRMFRRLGVGYMTLTHSANVPWADSCTDVPTLQGLSKFGEEVVREMNRIGMLVDLSHVSPDTMADAIRVSQAPVIFSHSNAKAVADSPRNVPDEILKQVVTNRGIVMVTFVPGFTSSEVAAYNRRATEQNKQFATQFPNDTAAQAAALAVWRKSNPEPRATLAQVADHVDHIRKVAGIDHIGFGGDFDGITSVVQGLEHVGTYPALVAELMRRGYTEADVAKITSGNILRVMREAEAVSAKLRTTPPSIKTIDKVDGITPRGQAVATSR
ncbi:MAG TPA: dipeptidase [Luteitalea sp.]|nr:dipeptidase [Luteitalea sp.]